ncbi:hypothetical protein BH11GEM1_BH11GEM1_35460 [soil metagenome]
MSGPKETAREGSGPDEQLARVTQELTNRLRARGVDVLSADSPEEVVQLMEGVEAFESAVESRGGDLMMDEPPAGRAGAPDDVQFGLPARHAGEGATGYLARLAEATGRVRKHPMRG